MTPNGVQSMIMETERGILMIHRNAWTVLGDENKFAISRHAGLPTPTVGHVVFKGEWEIEGDKQGRRFGTQSEAADTLLSRNP